MPVRPPATTPKRLATRLQATRSPAKAPNQPWAVLNVAPEVFQAVAEGRPPRLRGIQQATVLDTTGQKIVLRNYANGRLLVCRGFSPRADTVQLLTPGWLLMPEYRLSAGEYRTGRLVTVMSPNVPPGAKSMVMRLPVVVTV